MKPDFSKLRKGDLIKITQTVEVTEDGTAFLFVCDAKSRREFSLNSYLDSTLRYEMVRKAVRPRPKVGDVITGQQVRDTKWKRGTIIRHVRAASALVLTGTGEWIILDDYGTQVKFEDLVYDSKFCVEYAPE